MPEGGKWARGEERAKSERVIDWDDRGRNAEKLERGRGE